MDTRLWFGLPAVLDHAEYAASGGRFDDSCAGPCLLVDTASGATIRANAAAGGAAPAPTAAVHVDGDDPTGHQPAVPTLRLALTHPGTASPPQAGPGPEPASDDTDAGGDGLNLLQRLRRGAADGAAWFTIDLPDHGGYHVAVTAVRPTAELPRGVDWVPGLVAAGKDPACFDFGPYRAQVVHGYRRPDGGVYARFSIDAALRIAEDQRYTPGRRVGVPIEVLDGQVRHRRDPRDDQPAGQPLPADTDGWWRLDGDDWPWLLSDLGPDNPVWQPLFDVTSRPWGRSRRCTVCDAVDEIDEDDVPSRFGAGFVDGISRCRRCGSTEIAYAESATRAERAPWPTPRPAGGGLAGWDGREGLPAAWWRMPVDIRLRVRTRHSALEGVMLSSDLGEGLGVDGPLYVDLRHLTAWDTYRPGEYPTRAAYEALTDQFPGRFATVHDTNRPGTVFLALRLLHLTDPVADAVLTQRAATLTALGIDPDSPARAEATASPSTAPNTTST